MRRRKLMALLLSAASLPASATLIGDTVNLTDIWAGIPPQHSSPVVGNGHEFSQTFLIFSDYTQNEMAWLDFFLDISDTQVTVGIAQYGISSTPVSYHTLANREFLVADLDWIGLPGQVTGFSYASHTVSRTSDWVLDPSLWTTSFGPDSLYLQMTGGFNAALTNAEGVLISATFDITVDHSPIPEPATLTILSLGAIALLHRHRRQSTH